MRSINSMASPIGLMARVLSLAAAPSFAAMALLTGIFDRGPADVLCAGASPLSGMVPMYLLMSVFHTSPWLKLIRNQSRLESDRPAPEGERR